MADPKIQDPNSRPSPPIPEIDILWIAAGLGCDDTIAMTAATQPRLELAAGQRSVPVVVEDNKVLKIGWQSRSCFVDAK